MKRYHVLDDIRGITLVSMICYHGLWDWNYIFGAQWPWFSGQVVYWWQQSICWTFILLSGFCWPMGKRRLKRGMVVLAAGALLSLVTEIATPEQRVRFGILTLLGACMLLWILPDRLFSQYRDKGKKSGCTGRFALVGLGTCLFLFAMTRDINIGFLGFEGLHLWQLPEVLYHGGDPLSFLGFTDRGFFSADYFPLFPWIFLFGAGYFIYHLLLKRDRIDKMTRVSCAYENLPLAKALVRGLRWMGRHSLVIYLCHQPILYGALHLVSRLVNGN